MSYPDLGCFAECLTCELCETGLGPPSWDPDAFDVDLFPDSVPDDSDPFDLGDWAPPPEDDGPYDEWWEDLGLGDAADPPVTPLMPGGDGFGVKFGGDF